MQKKLEIDTVPELLTQAEAAAFLKKNPRWLERKRWQGGGPEFCYIGKSPRYCQAPFFSTTSK